LAQFEGASSFRAIAGFGPGGVYMAMQDDAGAVQRAPMSIVADEPK
jgi:hypothetical protein